MDTISSALKTKKYCAGVFLDIAKVFDTVWHDGLLFKLKSIFLVLLYLILKFYLENRSFIVRHNLQHSNQYPISVGVPQGNDIAPFLYNIYTSDLLTSKDTKVGICADDISLILWYHYDISFSRPYHCISTTTNSPKYSFTMVHQLEDKN